MKRILSLTDFNDGLGIILIPQECACHFRFGEIDG